MPVRLIEIVGALRLENHFAKLAQIELKIFWRLFIIAINCREETGLKKTVGSVWRISHGALPEQAYAQ